MTADFNLLGFFSFGVLKMPVDSPSAAFSSTAVSVPFAKLQVP